MSRTAIRGAALLGATTLLSATMAPAFAATVAQADANALTFSVAGRAAGTGTVTASHDGQALTRAGESQPPISLLQGQDVLEVGTLAQDATANVDDKRDGQSAACAGVAGDGAVVAEVGSTRCIEGGDNIGVNFANLDLTGFAAVNPASALGPLQAALLDPVEAQVLEPLTAALSAALQENLGPLSDLDIGGTIGAVESRCVASPGTASGTTFIADAKLGITLGGRTVQVINLPVEPAPNTKVVTDLDAVVNAVITGLETDLTTTLDAQLAGLTAVTQGVKNNIVDTIVNDISAQLAPLEENVLDITLNKQVFPAAGHIKVTAIDAQVLPAAAAELGASLVSAQVANVGCGPNGRFVAEESAVAPKAPGKKLPDVPTVIDSGAGDSGFDPVTVALLLAGAAGLVGYRRVITRG
ncbi:hypothetical protein [Nocardioides piscis]|uniref:Choice-of-anchor G family protein n=1 Tax=Nocardioides piscis TaxID=2714938 RepID=A0A6G7YBW9_9ACTN|nr:hypothetical protein [Nocardioides piscis]QIK74293.1 hypothetical protein G7071_01405 [Nocardioides piscis]